MKKRCQVIHLPTKDGNLFYNKYNPVGQQWSLDGESRRIGFKSQHLYILSDDEIKEGDWCYDKELNIIIHCNTVLLVSKHTIKNSKKIIATTDNLMVSVPHPNGGKRRVKDFVPQIPQSFIKEYVETGGIEWVNVEYEILVYAGKPNQKFKHPVVNSNNEIIIHPIEERIYSKKQIESLRELLKQNVDAKADGGTMRVSSGNLYWTFAGNIGKVIIDEKSIDNTIDNWIKENLK